MALTTEDRLEIHELYARYNHAVDFSDNEAWVRTFTEDGVFDAGPLGNPTGRDALREFAAGMAGSMRHWVNNLIIEETSGGATGKAYLAMLSPGGEGGGPSLTLTGIYNDELVKTADGWCFAKRVFTPER